MKLVQCWDDGVTTDVRLVTLLRRHGARATFNLNAGLHRQERQLGWRHGDTEVWRLGRGELREVYDGFSIANHTLTHPPLEQLPIDAARREIGEGRARLQALFDQPVSGFVYPFGTFDEAVAQAVRDAGHVYARTTRAAESGVDTVDAMAVAPSCHFLTPDFWQRLERSRPSGVFWFWGHSYELVDEAMWSAFEASLARLCAEPGVQWRDPTDLFDGDSP
ncbi:MAG: polysaccharide deacetylase family protein [Betaproteobacteria bacterium]|jgi:peptidoglycan/xylan/chitin deacetylase (PgdA/CDA1 family)